MKGFSRKSGEERIALYADDVLLFLGDTEHSLRQAINTVERFGNLTGLVVNLRKSALLPVDTLRNPIMSEIPQLEVVTTMKYLGINLTKDPNHYIDDNIVPLLTKFKRKMDIWNRLPLR